MSTATVPAYALEASKLARFPFEAYWPERKLRVCVTGAGGFIASHVAKRLKAEGHEVIACDWKKNEHMVREGRPTRFFPRRPPRREAPPASRPTRPPAARQARRRTLRAARLARIGSAADWARA
jgi:nucleoside-diphosphate-sugar epimerase